MSKYSSITVKTVIVALVVAVSFMISCTHQKSSDKQYSALDTAYFENSVHHWRDLYSSGLYIHPLPNQPIYKKNEITKIADNILIYQRDNGGWPKNYDMQAILTDVQKDTLIKTKNILNTTFDNWTTHSHIDYLAQVYTITKEEKYKDACLKGIDYVFSAQYPNGGWPQGWPDTSGYAKYITFNDGVFVGNLTLMQNLMNNKHYYSFVDNERREKAKIAFNKGLNCLLKCQIKENGVLNVWCQQHDNVDLRPQWARAFEPPSICNNESVDVVLFLMNLENPGKEVIKSIQSAVKWFKGSKIFGIRVKTISAPTVEYRWRKSSTDRIVVQDPQALPIWTRYYELGTHRPLFCNRDSKVVYNFNEIARERRDGYGWYTYAPQEILNKYPEWQQKWTPDNNVLK